MIAAPFAAADAAAALAPLAAIFIALAGALLMLRAPPFYVRRSLLLGALLAFFAGLAGRVFQ